VSKRYGQHCPLARALDVVGERWSMLVVRELSLGPRRFRDLLAGLPGIPTNLLSARLRDLQSAGLVDRRTLPPPAAVPVYELTEAGHALRPALTALREWGRTHAPAPADTDAARPGWALLGACGRPTELAPGIHCRLRIGEEEFVLGADESGLRLADPAATADTTIELDEHEFFLLAAGNTTAAAALRAATVDGDRDVARATLRSLHRTLS
jgi:DNA-binding HxlR family transcriptional regulator